MPSIKRHKPEKPRPDFPLTAHAGGAWCKKIGGRIYYFGSWDDPDAAAAEYQSIRESLQAGIDPRKQPAGNMQLGDLCNLYLHREKQRADAGEIRHRTWRERRDLCKRIADVLGRTTPVCALRPEHFARLKMELAKTLGHVALKNALVRARGVFRWGFESEHLATAVRFGPDFKPAKQSVIRAARNAGPKRFIEAVTIRKILTGAPMPMQAMVFLAINGALGNRDIAALKLSNVNLKLPWLDYPRAKTATPRRIPLWPETVKSLRAALAERRESSHENFFLTRFGNPWFTETTDGKFNDEISKGFKRLLKELKLDAPGVNFYALRHTFRTIADQTRDVPAIELIMGHAGDPADMAKHYIEHIDDDRLKAVTDHVHSWLYAKAIKTRTRR